MTKTPLHGSRRKFFADCSCFQPVFRADAPQLGRRDVMYGRPPLGKGFLGFRQTCRGAVMYAAFECGR